MPLEPLDYNSLAHDAGGAGEGVLPIERMAYDLNFLRKNIRALLRHVGDPALCTGPNCKQEIYWVRHLKTTNAKTPYNLDGSNHFITCVDHKEFRGERKGRNR
jgi:hypothetical protein